MKIKIKKNIIKVALLSLLLLVLLYLLCSNMNNKDNFSIPPSSNKVDLYFIYADWCGHCKKTKPGIESLKSKYSNNSNVNVHMIDSDDSSNKNILNEHNVKGFPTIILKKNGSVVDNNCPRKEQQLVTLINKHLQ